MKIVQIDVLDDGDLITSIERPLHEVSGRPAVKYRRKLWFVTDGKISLEDGPIDSEPDGLTVSPGEEASESIAGVSRPEQEGDLSRRDAGAPNLLRVAIGEFDSAQADVIKSDRGERLVVDAGPGTGKTAVACARIANLIQDGRANPSKIWMISFTRTAVAEIRARLYSYVGEESFSVKVATLDAHAWALHSGFDEKASLTGSYDQNIRSLTNLIQEDEETQDYLYEVQHLIIDEAQDIVGVRAKLIESIIRYLSPGCGVTIFADEAQAIYDFSEDHTGSAAGPKSTFLDGFKSEESGFSARRLTTVHRTSCDGLKEIFTDIRREVLEAEQRPGIFGKIYERIRAVVGEESQDIKKDPPWETLSSGDLVLFRTRAEALQAAQFNNSPYSLRLGGYGGTLPPWLAICFHDWTDRHIDKNQFAVRWQERVRQTCPPAYEHDEAWQKLSRIAGSGEKSLDLWILRQSLSRRTLPVDLAEPDYGLAGPIIGTVHASKGREADDVLFYVPGNPNFRDEQSEAEETRILFVGSTRARRSLRIGMASRSYAKSLKCGRVYRTLNRSSAMLEIGRPSDQSISGLVASKLQSQENAERSQAWLARHACVMTQLEFNSDPDREWSYGAPGPSEGSHLTSLSSSFNSDYWELVGEISDRKKFRPAPRIPYVKSLGAMTIVVAPDDPSSRPCTFRGPSQALLWHRDCPAFTKVYIWKR